ncbi:hypothetical protein [Mucilaginibacter gotjawali]|uniref:Uncharacterized protein n=2 Tax=Mucilaginibacter gotjawali TaxID=1550579 RepID=A0A120MXP1_9SPHI|nr:hypothetical protein [Mucilaginibacter gotjawali]MBB3054292.1 hypothetical protein [Mucilaginibacter gotjawali]BAU51874.1 hypothetical protein MgSA37_00023 [Mucilaginibacter gotjawali]
MLQRKLDKRSKYIFFLMNSVYYGFLISLGYGIISSLIVYFFANNEFSSYIKHFFISFNSFLTGGLAFGLTYQVYKTQNYIPEMISNVFEKHDLDSIPQYKEHNKRFHSVQRSMTIVTLHIVISFLLFYYAKFPFINQIPETFMVIFGCSLFGCGVYVGRKIFYVAQILQTIENIEFNDDIFSDNKLEGIAVYVNVITTFTVITTWLLIRSYYGGPFVFDSMFGRSIKIFMFYPAITALPVLVIFNYYPKVFIRKIYTRSINNKLNLLEETLRGKEKITEFEKIKYLSEVDKISQEELKNRLRLALNDLPLVITIIVMLINLFIQIK